MAVKFETVLSMMCSFSAKAKLLGQENIFMFMTATVELERRSVVGPV